METPIRNDQPRSSNVRQSSTLPPLPQEAVRAVAPEPEHVRYVQPVYTSPRERERRDLSGCSLPSLRCLGCTGCFLLLALFVFGIYVLIARPPVVWDPVKEWFNAGLQTVPYDQIAPAAVYVDMQDQLAKFTVGENRWVITQDQLRSMIVDRIKGVQMPDLNVDMMEGKVKLFWNGDPNSDVPLWYVVEIGINDKGQPYFTKLGTERIGTPGFLNELLTGMFLSAVRIGSNQQPDQLVNVLVPLPNNVTVKGVQFEEDEMVIVINVSTGLENLFVQ